MRALVTGASGFIGSFLCPRLREKGIWVRAAVREPATVVTADDLCSVGDLSGSTCWADHLDGIDTVFHLAGRAHTFEKGSHAEIDCQRVNVDATEALARAAALRSVRSFVFLSTVKVHGDADPGRPLREDDPLWPEDIYATSKRLAEQKVMDAAHGSGMRVTIVRPPLVYGPGVKANFLTLLRLVDRRVPLPLSGVVNSRSFVYVGNLSEALLGMAMDQGSRGPFFVSDGDDVSTPELIRRIAEALRRPARMFRIPTSMLKGAAAITGKRKAAESLLSSLRVDIGRIRESGWRPRFSMRDGLAATANWFVRSGHR